MNTDTIAAIATPSGIGGIGIIRISGPAALAIATTLFRAGGNGTSGDGAIAGRRPQGLFRSHRLYYGHIVDPVTKIPVDEVLLAVMRAPRSYTRQDVVEIQAHAGAAVLRRVLELVLRQGARMADPGEFTQRAFFNGRIDLTQAEAVIDVINARTQTALAMAAQQAAGRLKQAVENIRGLLIELLVPIEAAIDFPDDVPEIRAADQVAAQLHHPIAGLVTDLMSRYKQGHIYRDGLKLVIVGRPNVGKSSLLNRLLDRERSIVTTIPGTTRDFVEDSFQVQGVPVTVTDTAGLHDAADPIEKIGMSKTMKCLETADLILLVIDGSEELTEDDRKIFKICEDKPIIVTVNKIDLFGDRKNGVAVLPDNRDAETSIGISALYGDGIEELKQRIAMAAGAMPYDPQHNAAIPNLRHQQALEKCHQHIMTAIEGLVDRQPSELVAIDIREAVGCCDEILGFGINFDVLDQIFSRFCIGK
ncbi:MAG: tRNA uridine-5-carboxymethylaminomethyl(34) synthesis GTPase MnmE [Desulfobacterales bacterium]